jgi:hypothetical protein
LDAARPRETLAATMTYKDDTARRVRGRLKAMKDSLPKWATFPERYVRDYEGLVTELRNVGFDVSGFHVEPGHLRREATLSNYLTGEVTYPDEAHIDSATFLTRIGGLLSYLDDLLAPAAPAAAPKADSRAFTNVNISGGNVNFGDGSSINITTITVAQLLQALERHIESTVADPMQKKSLLAKVSEVLKHPAATTALQVGLPQLLKLLSGGEGGGI